MNRRKFAAAVGVGWGIEACPIEAAPITNSIEAIEAARHTIAQSIRTRLTHLHRYCNHAECWDLAVQNIAAGADHITFGPCCHDYPNNRTYYRVIAEWLVMGEFGVEGSRLNPSMPRRKQGKVPSPPPR